MREPQEEHDTMEEEKENMDMSSDDNPAPAPQADGLGLAVRWRDKQQHVPTPFPRTVGLLDEDAVAAQPDDVAGPHGGGLHGVAVEMRPPLAAQVLDPRSPVALDYAAVQPRDGPALQQHVATVVIAPEPDLAPGPQLDRLEAPVCTLDHEHHHVSTRSAAMGDPGPHGPRASACP